MIESRKLVLMNLFVGSNGDSDIENRFVDTGARRRGWDGWRE